MLACSLARSLPRSRAGVLDHRDCHPFATLSVAPLLVWSPFTSLCETPSRDTVPQRAIIDNKYFHSALPSTHDSRTDERRMHHAWIMAVAALSGMGKTPPPSAATTVLTTAAPPPQQQPRGRRYIHSLHCRTIDLALTSKSARGSALTHACMNPTPRPGRRGVHSQRCA
jgi:hypothetical protein